MSDDQAREALLLQMYVQMFRDIEQHLKVVWQSAALLVSSFAGLGLASAGLVDPSIAAALVGVVATWSLAHCIDAAYWYNRNLAIIGNIERQFLRPSDLHDVHYYFGAHRPSNRAISFVRIQVGFAISTLAVVLFAHLVGAVDVGWTPLQVLPYLVVALGAAVLVRIKRQRNRSYEEFLSNSPGVELKGGAVSFGPGHGHPPRSSEALS